MKKKIILVVIVVFAVAVSGVFVLTKCLKTNSNHEQVNVVEEKDEEFNLQEEEQSKMVYYMVCKLIFTCHIFCARERSRK